MPGFSKESKIRLSLPPKAVLLMAAGLFLFFLLSPTDPDLGWHLRYGQEIWQTHAIPRTNEYSVLLAGYPWPDHSWLYQTAIYPLWSVFGLWGLTIANALLLTAAFLLFFETAAIPVMAQGRTEIKGTRALARLEKFLLILATLYFGWGVFSFGLRSQLLGFFFFNLTLYILSQLANKPRLVFLLPLVTLLWAQSHGSVVLAVPLLLLMPAFWRPAPPEVARFALPLLAVGVTLLNPFGFSIYREAIRHVAGGVDLSTVIAEWVPPQPPVWWLVALSAVVLIFLLVRESLSMAILVASFALLALKARRNVPLYLLVGGFSFLVSGKAKRLLTTWQKQREMRHRLFVVLVVLLLLYGALVRLPQTVEANSSWENFCRVSSQGAPCAAVEFLRGQKERGNIFNRYEWGGFLIWQLPEYKIFVDGRMPAWSHPSGKSPYTIYLQTLQTRPGWQKTLDDYRIDWILISPGTFMDLKLRPDPQKFGWKEVFRDRVSVVYQKD